MKVCSQCGAENREAAQLCRMCTHVLTGLIEESARPANEPPEFASTIIGHMHSAAPIECQSCGTPNEEYFNFCQKCGSHLVKDELPEETQTVVIEGPPPALQKYDTDPYRTTPATSAMLQCLNCLNEVAPGSRFCNLCGTPLGAGQPAAALPRFCLRLIVDGEESDEVYQLGPTTVIGRLQGDIHFPYDDYMSSQHASITRRGGQFFLKDEGSRNGTLIIIESEVELKPGSVFMVGRQLFKFESGE